MLRFIIQRRVDNVDTDGNDFSVFVTSTACVVDIVLV